MSLDDAIKKMTDVVKSVSAGAEVKTVKMSDEEARLSVYAPAGDIQGIKDAGFTVMVDAMWGNGAGWFTRLLEGGKTRVIEIHNTRNPSFPEMKRPEPIMNTRTQLVALYTLVRKENQRVFRIWLQTILPPAITTALYFLIFGNLIGKRIGQMDGYDYAQFIAPGLIMMQVINNAYGNVVSSFFSAKMQRHLEEMLVAPMSTWAIVLGHTFGGVVRGLAVAAAVTVVALFFTRLHVAHVLVTFSAVTLTAFVFSLGGLINAILPRTSTMCR